MQPLPCDFLEQIASKYELSPKQKEAFLEQFGSCKDQQAIADALYISTDALRTRLSGVYTKFSIKGKGPGKVHKLRDFLTKEYQRHHPSPIVNALEDGIDINALVQEVREKVSASIQNQCGTMRVLDMAQPIGLSDIYTNVNILEKITGRRRLGIEELLQECNPEDFERFGLGRILEERVPGLKAVQCHSKLMVLGKPGAGKTTFLKHLAIQCNSGEFQANRVPIFILLKQFAETPNQQKLLEFITQQLANKAVTDTQISELMKQGRALLLLDGLDEVREEDSSRVITQIKEFSDQYHTHQFVITCRIAVREYTFEQFTEVEVADFDDEQIAEFSYKWFQIKDPVKGKKFMNKLEENRPVKELATNPLLLTLLCLVFEESAEFPSNRSELYQEGLNVLLKKWDVKRNIERDQAYKQLSLQRKKDLLSQIALTTFSRGDYFFKQEEVEQHIRDYICNLPDANTDPKVLQLDSEAVLKSIEAQHGLLVERAKVIYSFSHLTFQEYFTAKKIVETPGSQATEALENLVSHITEKRWREVFLLAVSMLKPADDLLQLMKSKIDAILATDEKMQHLLNWVNQKSDSVQAGYKPAAVRAFCFDLAHDRVLDRAHDCDLTRDRVIDLTRDLAHDCDRDLARDRAHDCDLTRDLAYALDLARALTRDRALNRNLAHALSFFLNCSLNLAPTRELKQTLKELAAQLPNLEDDSEMYQQWWKDKGRSWIEELRVVMIEYRDIGHDWQFSKEQEEMLQQYYDANLLLVNCLNSDCYVNRSVCTEIEATLLLPIAEIEKRQQK